MWKTFGRLSIDAPSPTFGVSCFFVNKFFYSQLKPSSDQQQVLYFGYGSNLSLDNFAQYRNIKVISYCRGVINDWKLSFSLCYPTKTFANIHRSKGDEVHGVIMKLTQNDLDKLCKLEVSYRLIQIKGYSYEDKLDPLNLNTFIFDQQCENKIKKEIQENKNIKQVMRYFDITGDGKKPTKNYLDTIIHGAKKLKLDEDYIKTLERIESIPILKYNPTLDQIKQINNKIWNMTEIKQYLMNNPNECISIFKGIVFDMADYPSSRKQIANGRDITMVYAARWSGANENNCKSIESMEDDQKLYINGEAQKFLNGIYNIRILGKMDAITYPFAYDNYTW